MTSFRVNNGINLGEQRFEVDEVVKEETLDELITKKARKWLVRNGDLEEIEEETVEEEDQEESSDEPAGEE